MAKNSIFPRARWKLRKSLLMENRMSSASSPRAGDCLPSIFKAGPGPPPHLSRPLDANDVFVITSLGPQATLYAGNQLKNVMLGDQKITSTAAGSGLPALTDQNRVLKYG